MQMMRIPKVVKISNKSQRFWYKSKIKNSVIITRVGLLFRWWKNVLHTIFALNAHYTKRGEGTKLSKLIKVLKIKEKTGKYK